MGVTLSELGAAGECTVTISQALKLNNLDLKISTIKALIDAVEAKLDDPSKGLAALKTLIDTIVAAECNVSAARAAKLDNLDNQDNFKADVSALATAAALAVVDAEIAAIEAKLDNPDDFKADVTALATAAALAAVFDAITTDVHIIEDESTYNDTTLHEVKANKEYPILEVVLSGGVVTVYNYEWDVGDAGVDPSETQARTEITHFSADAFELSKIFVNINKATNGLWTRMAADDKAYMYAKYYDSTASAFVLVPDIVLRDKFVDTLKSALPIDTDLGEGVVFDGAKLQLASRFIIYFYVDDDIDYLVEIPFTFGVRRI